MIWDGALVRSEIHFLNNVYLVVDTHESNPDNPEGPVEPIIWNKV